MKILKNSINKQFLIVFLFFSITLILLFNLYIKQNSKSTYLQNQSIQSTVILDVLSSKIQLPLIVADQESIRDTLNEFSNFSSIFSVSIKDASNNLIASKQYHDSNMNHQEEKNSNYIFRKTVVNESNDSEFEDIFGEDATTKESKIIGYIEMAVIPYDQAVSLGLDKHNIFYNIILIASLLSFFSYLAIKNKVHASNLRTIENLLTGQPSLKPKAFSAIEFRKIYDASLQMHRNLVNHETKLLNLQQEIRYAREDGNLELNHFMGFLDKHNIFDFDDNLQIFSDAILAEKSQEMELTNISKVIKRLTTKYSSLAQENNILIHEHYLSQVLDNKISIDRTLFTNFFDLFLSQLIILCKNSELLLNVEITEIQANNQIFRLSIESKAPSFLSALETQSLFDFDHSKVVSIANNNARFIAAKHLLQKAGGDYFFLQEEIRFEFPVHVEKNIVVNSNLLLVNPLSRASDILVYDSDPIERMVLMGYLEKLGQNVDKATTKQVVLQKIRHQDYHVICVNPDFFSEQDPYFLTNFRSEYNASKNKPAIIVLTEHSNNADEEVQFEFDAQQLSKPIDLNKLAALLS